MLPEAVATARAAVAAVSDDDPYRAICLSRLGTCLRALSERPAT